MRRAIAICPLDPLRQVGTVTLAAHDRHRRRIRMTDDDGEDFLLDLPSATYLRDGDGLALDDGGIVAVRAALEEVADIHAASPEQAARLAWHVGNRHVPVQIGEGWLRFQTDEVLAKMLRGMGVEVTILSVPFEPEAGAYAGGHSHHSMDAKHSGIIHDFTNYKKP